MEINHRTGAFQIPACGHRHAAALAVLQIFLQRVPPPIRSATIVRSPTVMFLRQGMGLWSGTALPKTRIKAESMKAEIEHQRPSAVEQRRNEGTKLKTDTLKS